MTDRVRAALDLYRAFAEGDREAVERAFAPDLRFSSPVDVGLDRAGYFERCWPGSGKNQTFEFIRTIESGDEVIVTYLMTGADGKTGRNTEIIRFDGERICEVEVYFGW